MAKSKSKGEKLDVLIAEVAKLKSRMKALLKQQAAIATAVGKLKRNDTPKNAAKTKKAKAAKTRHPAAAPKPEKKRGPVLVQTSPAAAKGAS